MRGFPSSSSESHSAFLFRQPSPSNSSSNSNFNTNSNSNSNSNSIPTTTHSLSFFHHPPSPIIHFKTLSISTPKPCLPLTPSFFYSASKSDTATVDVDGDDDDDSDDVNSSGDLLLIADDDADDVEESESLAEDGVYIEVTKLDKNSRRIESRISIDASLDAVWSILTDYDRLADFIPSLAASQLLQKGHNYARLLQIGQQNLPFGITFNAKVVLDCYEKELENLPSGMKRDIEFKMIEGDFQLFEGKWSILQQFKNGGCKESQFQAVNTTLSYIVDVKPKLWLPVRLIEGILCNEIKRNLESVRDEAQKAIDSAVNALQFE